MLGKHAKQRFRIFMRGGKIRRILIKLGKRFPRRSFSRRFPSSFSICLESHLVLSFSVKLLSFFFLALSLQFTFKRVISRSFSWSFRGLKEKKTYPRGAVIRKPCLISRESRIHAFWQREDIFQRNLIVRFFLEKSHFFFLFNFHPSLPNGRGCQFDFDWWLRDCGFATW